MPSPHRAHFYLDSIRVGHAYLELFGPDDGDEGEVYGFYPERFDGDGEVLVDRGEIRHDRERLERVRARPDLELLTGRTDLSPEQYRRAAKFLDDFEADPRRYYFLGYNCIDFLQDVYRAARDDERADVLRLFRAADLARVSATGWYAVVAQARQRVGRVLRKRLTDDRAGGKV